MLTTRDVPFGEWLPSRPDYKSPGCVVADNCIPSPGGYSPLYAPAVSGETVTGTCKGAKLFFSLDGTETVIGGTDDSLFKNDAGIVATTTGYTSIGTGEAWDFAQFNNILVATSISNNPQYLDDIDSDTTWADLPGSPPKARYCARVEDFLMLGDIESNRNRIQWSAFNSPTSAWGTDRLSQAGFADLPPEFGPVRRIVGGRYPLVFQERGVSRLEYVGPPVVWRRLEIEQARGALAPFSVVTVGFITYVLSQDGFYATDGSSFEPIGSDRVNRWFFDNCNGDNVYQTHGAIDWQNECVVWAFKASSSTNFNRLIIYSWAQNRWSSATVQIERLVETADQSVTLEQLGAQYSSLEAVPFSLDDERWRPRFRSLAAYVDDGDNTDLAPFNGAPLEARFETGEMQPAPGRWVHVGGARPLFQQGGAGTTVGVISYGNGRNSNVSSFRAPGVDGFVPLRISGQTMRLAATVPAGTDWRGAQGLQVRFRPQGAR